MMFRCAILLVMSFAAAAFTANAQPAGSTWAILIGGLGGDAAYTERFEGYLNDTRTHLVHRFGVPESQIVVLGETQIAEQPFVDGPSDAERIQEVFREMAGRVGSSDRLLVVFYGHGSYDGMNAAVNIPRRDLTDREYANLLESIEAERIIVVNTASASGPFTSTLAGPDRIVITATATGTERDATIFPQYFVEALRAPEADLDRDGGVSIRELFVYATTRTARSFEESGHIVTEHALLEDDGDGTGTRAEALDGSTDGHLAATTFLQPPVALTAADRSLVLERQELERAIAAVMQRKSTLSEDAYYAQLEELFVRLARVNRRIESAQ